ncbi:unnamed protein product [Prorocentrum cordatum]|uniref:Uncharacterized protein n=1 Tax=Prorocentrum cordatum TaxID=2364126 RepID=A0ABN9WNP6_9DINO|nr:unnamed protein product [Polarella glacialis]
MSVAACACLLSLASALEAPSLPAPSVCEHAALSTGETWACRPCNAFYVKFLTTMLPGTSLLAHILVDETADSGTRVLFAFEKKGEEPARGLAYLTLT